MSFRCARRALMCAAFLLLLAPHAASAADCSDKRIRDLYERGRTVASIARTCDMERDEVQEILDETPAASNDEDEGSDADSKTHPGRKPRGTPVGQCGCWGPADPNYQQPHAECSSGYAHPQMCPAQCPLGGFAWQGVCS